MTVWVWLCDDEVEVYASLDVAVREHNLTDPNVETGDDGLRFIQHGGYRCVIAELKVTE